MLIIIKILTIKVYKFCFNDCNQNIIIIILFRDALALKKRQTAGK